MILPIMVPPLDDARSIHFIGKVVRFFKGRGINMSLVPLGDAHAVCIRATGKCAQTLIGNNTSNRVSLLNIAEILHELGYRTASDMVRETAFNE